MTPFIESLGERQYLSPLRRAGPGVVKFKTDRDQILCAIRSVPASPQDNVYCSILAQNAVHAGMAGKTNMLVGRWHDSFVHIPLKLATQSRRKIDPEGDIWRFVLEATGQPPRML
jgi:6-phosphofructokinase